MSVDGIVSTVLASISIIVDFFLVFLAAKLSQRTKEVKDSNNAEIAIKNREKEYNKNTFLFEKPNNTKKRKAQKILNKLKKNSYFPRVSAIEFVISFKPLFNGKENVVVEILMELKTKKWVSWEEKNLNTGTSIYINCDEEENIIEYFSSCKPR